MNKIWRVAVMMAAALALLLGFGAQSVRAEEIRCVGTLGAITVDNVLVPEGRTCTLNKTRVQGTVQVAGNATLYAKTARINGNVQAENAKLVSVTANTTVGDSIQVKQGGAATINRVTVEGDIQFDDNAKRVQVLNNTVGGSIQVFENTGGAVIKGNRVDGNLQCKSNTPAPTGGGNVVQGNKEDQCRRL